MEQLPENSDPAKQDEPRPRLSRRTIVGLGASAAVGAGAATFAAGLLRAQDATPEPQGSLPPGRSPATDASPHPGHGGTPLASSPATPASTPFTGTPGQALVQPERRESSGGVLETRLEAKLSPTTIAGQPVVSTVYDGSFPGPTLVMQPGDTLRLQLVNSLDDCTNIHTHGFHVSPLDNSDNVFLHISPGETFDYEFHLPDNHSSGVFWYHPHCHGNTASQTTGGMAGAMIVRGGLDDIEGIAGLTDHLLVLQTTEFTGDGEMVTFFQQSSLSRIRLINGQLQPTIAVQPGETQRWRIANLSSEDFFLLQLEGHTLHAIAKDGCSYDEVVPLDEILLAPAERLEVLVQATTTPGSYQLRSLAWGIDDQEQPDALLATMVVDGDVLEPSPLPTTLIPFEDLSELPVDRRRVTTFSEPGAPLYFAIDDQHFDPERIDQTVSLGDLEEWVIRNTSGHQHPFHIHVNDFQVVAVNGQPVSAHGWEDTVDLPPNGEVTIRMRFADFTGRFVYHCHILSHEDDGMMATVEVVE